MSVGIDNTLKTFDDLGSLAVDAIAVVKAGGFKLTLLPKIFDAIMQAGKLATDAQASLPELKDLDANEAGILATAAFDLVAKVIGAVGSVSAPAA